MVAALSKLDRGRRRIIRLTVGRSSMAQEDMLAVEEPLEIRVGGRSLAVMPLRAQP